VPGEYQYYSSKNRGPLKRQKENDNFVEKGFEDDD
jgi:hypothetical protein